MIVEISPRPPTTGVLSEIALFSSCRRFNPFDMDDLHLTLEYYADLPRFNAASRTDQCHRIGGAVHGGPSTAPR
jgi:hypothetical protein